MENKELQEQIIAAAKDGDYARLKKLLESRKERDYEQLISVVEKKDYERLEALLKAGLDPNDRQEPKLIDKEWSWFGPSSGEEYYYPAKYTAPGPRPLDIALKMKDERAVALLLTHGAETDEPRKVTAFREELRNKRYFKALLNSRASKNI